LYGRLHDACHPVARDRIFQRLACVTIDTPEHISLLDCRNIQPTAQCPDGAGFAVLAPGQPHFPSLCFLVGFGLSQSNDYARIAEGEILEAQAHHLRSTESASEPDEQERPVFEGPTGFRAKQQQLASIAKRAGPASISGQRRKYGESRRTLSGPAIPE
jgi:hypothetical protein